MPIRIPDLLPARKLLESEGVMVMDERTALRQDIRPMRIGLLNLMPDKIRTEAQIARLVGSTPLQVEMTLVRIGSHTPRNTAESHLIDFYKTWDEIRDQKFDGFIITGAPIETLEFNDVNYWSELTQIFDWTQTNVHSLFTVCWGAMAAINYFHNVPKYTLDEKAFGVFRHRNLNPSSPYLAGFSDDFSIPVSRWTEVRSADIAQCEALELLMESEETGPCLVAEEAGNRLYIFNHIEYDSTSLADEYNRDLSNNVEIAMPKNYYPEDNPSKAPLNRWRSHAHLLFRNWIHAMYQSVPYNIQEIGKSL